MSRNRGDVKPSAAAHTRWPRRPADSRGGLTPRRRCVHAHTYCASSSVGIPCPPSFVSQQASEIQMRRLVSVLGVVGILLGATAPAVAGVTVGASRLTHSVVDVCGPATPGTARCHAKLVVYGNGLQSGLQPFAGTPSGFNPGDLQSAYNLPSATDGAGMTVAIVDAYDDPKAESDLAVYRSQFPGLPACTTSNGCFRKVNQS